MIPGCCQHCNRIRSLHRRIAGGRGKIGDVQILDQFAEAILGAPSTPHTIAPCQIQGDHATPLNSFSRPPPVCSVSADDGCAVGVLRLRPRPRRCCLVFFILVIFVAAISVVVVDVGRVHRCDRADCPEAVEGDKGGFYAWRRKKG